MLQHHSLPLGIRLLGLALGLLGLTLAGCAVSPEVTPLPIDAGVEIPDTGIPDAGPPVIDGGDEGTGPPPPGTDESYVGWLSDSGDQRKQAPSGQMLIIRLPPLPIDAYMVAWGFVSSDIKDVQFRMALYEGFDGEPDLLVDETLLPWPSSDPFVPASGAPLFSGAEYWLMLLFENDYALGRSSAMAQTTVCAQPFDFLSEFPFVFDPPMSNCQTEVAPTVFILVTEEPPLF